ncbi:hypothetical protein B6I21_04465 [candidate division KSB1 bacterium 4572_119]|nr:MAG: hypothetical protein B6I21_04465 [candidate division KSB1 bacterium 4572_119]
MGVLIVLVVSLASGLNANGLNGGRGLTYVKSAWSLKPGYLTLYGRSQVFGKVASHEGASNAVSYWNIQGAFSLNYGVSKHLEFAISPIMYQDTQRGEKRYIMPGDLYMGLKFGSYNIKRSSLTWGISLDTRFPTGKESNIVFEPYSAGTVEWGFTGMLSYSKDPLYPEEELNVDFNIGYLNHNDVGESLSANSANNFNVTSMTQEILYGFGLKIPSSEFDFSVELYGNSFIQKPPKETAYSIENYFYLTPTISYHAFKWLTFKVGADFRLSSNTDETTYEYISKFPEALPNYPTWRLNFGVNILLLPTNVFRVSDKDILIRKAENRRELFEQIINEQRETESAEEELDRIKAERKKAERELERLRRILEGDKNKKTTSEPPPSE